MSDLRKALEFYADPANYDDFIGRPPGRDSYFHSAHVKLDKGERARQALLIPPAPDGATEGLAKMIDKRLFILSGPEGSGAYVKIGFADIKDASSAHAALASLSVSPVRPKGEEDEQFIARIIANHMMDEFEWPRSLAERTGATLAATIIWANPSQPTQTGEEKPIPMILHCPACGLQHVDAPDTHDEAADKMLSSPSVEPWNNPPHRSHLCRPEHGGCGHIWRPADVPTEGVAAITTWGKNDSPPATRKGEEMGSDPVIPCLLCGRSNADPRPWDTRSSICPDCEDREHGSLPVPSVHREIDLDYAKGIAKSVAARCFPDSPDFKTLPDMNGVLSQIDNMTCGMVQVPSQPTQTGEEPE